MFFLIILKTMVFWPRLLYISFKNLVIFVISIQDGFYCKQLFIYLLQIFIDASLLISIFCASLYSLNKNLSLVYLIWTYQILIVGAVTQLIIADFKFFTKIFY